MVGVPVGSCPWRQWKVVGDLLSGKHQEAIDRLIAEADAEDENPALDAYFITAELFDMNKAVPAVLQVRTIERDL